jgi:hypothetical protein
MCIDCRDPNGESDNLEDRTRTIGAFGATGLAALVAHFGKPLKAATVRFRCPIETGFQLHALSSDNATLATKTVPTIPSCTFTSGYSDVTVTVANPPYISILVASGPPHPAQPDTALDYDRGVEYWIVPDSSSRLQITVSGSPDGTSAFVGDTMKYLASATDGAAVTINKLEMGRRCWDIAPTGNDREALGNGVQSQREETQPMPPHAADVWDH